MTTTIHGIEVSRWEWIAGYSVVETSHLAFDQVIVSSRGRVVLCGEIAHLSYRIQMAYLKDAIRADVEEKISALAQCVGVDWPVTSH